MHNTRTVTLPVACHMQRSASGRWVVSSSWPLASYGQWLCTLSAVNNTQYNYNKLSYCRGTARCVVSIEILPVATQQCRNYLYDKVLSKSMVWSWRFSRRQCVIDNVHSTMMRPSPFHCLRCVINKPTTDDLWISPVYRRLAVAKFSKSTI